MRLQSLSRASQSSFRASQRSTTPHQTTQELPRFSPEHPKTSPGLLKASPPCLRAFQSAECLPECLQSLPWSLELSKPSEWCIESIMGAEGAPSERQRGALPCLEGGAKRPPRPTAREALRAGVLRSKSQQKHEADKYGVIKLEPDRVSLCEAPVSVGFTQLRSFVLDFAFQDAVKIS